MALEFEDIGSIASGGWTAHEPSGTQAVPDTLDYVMVYKAAPMERIRLIRSGITAVEAKKVMGDLVAIPIPVTSQALDIPISTLNRKAKNGETLGPGESERVVGLARLIGQVQTMVEESGDPTGFDAAAWTARWLNEPLPALGEAKPAEFMGTMEGQRLISNLLARTQSGAYS